MTEQRGGRAGSKRLPFEIDTTVAHPARIHNYLSGGEENFAADREAVDHLSAAFPGGIDAVRNTAGALRTFMVRTLRYLIDGAGVRQFLKIGTTIPTEKDVHEIAQESVPESRVVYVGNDPVVLAHAHALRTSKPEGVAAYVHGTLSEPEDILCQAAATLDFSQPVAVIVLTTLNFVPDASDPYGIMALLMRSLAPGSCLALAHTTGDLHPDTSEASRRLSESLREPYVLRSHAEIVRFFDGLKMVGPGLVPIDKWPRKRPNSDGQHLVPIYGGVGIKSAPSRPPEPAVVTPLAADFLAGLDRVDRDGDRLADPGRRYEEVIRFSRFVDFDDHLAIVDFIRRKIGAHTEAAKVKTSEGRIQRSSLSGALRLVEPTEEDIEEVHLRLDAYERGDLTVTSIWRRGVRSFPTITVEGRDHAQVVGVAAVIRRFVERRDAPRRPWWRSVGAWFCSTYDDLSVQVVGGVLAGVVLAALSALWLIFV